METAFVDDTGTFHCICGASHKRGPINGATSYRCLRCGHIATIEKIEKIVFKITKLPNSTDIYVSKNDIGLQDVKLLSYSAARSSHSKIKDEITETHILNIYSSFDVQSYLSHNVEFVVNIASNEFNIVTCNNKTDVNHNGNKITNYSKITFIYELGKIPHIKLDLYAI